MMTLKWGSFMNKEVKAILEFLDDNLWVKYGNTYQKSLTDKECKLLLDHITNLQEDLDKANKIIEDDRKFYKGRLDEWLDYRTRIEKAIDKI